MKPTSIPVLAVAAVVATAIGAGLAQLIAMRGGQIPVAGLFTGLLMILAGVLLLLLGLPMRRYLKESEERRLQPTLAPRRTELDLTTAFRVIVAARAAAWTGSLATGFFTGEALYLAMHGGDLLTGVLPTGFAALGSLFLAVVGVIVERWGVLPPDDGEAGTAQGDRSGAA